MINIEWLFRLLGILSVLLMWRIDGADSAMAFSFLVIALLLLEKFAENVGDYLGWIGSLLPINQKTPAIFIRSFCNIVLTLLTVLLLFRYLQS